MELPFILKTFVSGAACSDIVLYKLSLTIKVPTLFAKEKGLSNVVMVTVTGISVLFMSSG